MSNQPNPTAPAPIPSDWFDSVRRHLTDHLRHLTAQADGEAVVIDEETAASFAHDVAALLAAPHMAPRRGGHGSVIGGAVERREVAA